MDNRVGQYSYFSRILKEAIIIENHVLARTLAYKSRTCEYRVHFF